VERGVPVHDAVAVQVVHGQQNLIEDVKGLFFGQFLLLPEVLEELAAFDELADDVVVLSVFVHAEYFDDVGVVLHLKVTTTSRKMLN
jgi:hypothetical protein